jgi:hypothetical protein
MEEIGQDVFIIPNSTSMDFEKQQAGAASREDFASNEEQVAAKKQAIAEATAAGDYDKITALAQEAKGLGAGKNEMMANTEDVARMENAKRDYDKVSALAQEAIGLEWDKNEMLGAAKDEAETENAERDMAAKEAAAQEKARIAEEDRLSAEADAAAAAKLAEQIKGGLTDEEKALNEDRAEYAQKSQERASRLNTGVGRQKERLLYQRVLHTGREVSAEDVMREDAANENLERSRAVAAGEIGNGNVGVETQPAEAVQENSVAENTEKTEEAMSTEELANKYLWNGEPGYISGKLSRAPESLRSNKEFMMEAIAGSKDPGNVVNYAGEDLKNDKEFALYALSIDEINSHGDTVYQKLSPGLQGDKDVVLAALKAHTELNKIPAQFLDKETVLSVLQEVDRGGFLDEIPIEVLKDKDVIEAIKTNPYRSFRSEKLRNDPELKRVVTENGFNVF